MIGHINYGGRVTDDWDRTCLLTILKKYFSTESLEKNFKYSHSGFYYCPAGGLIEEYRNFIDTLPNIDKPEVFGMTENANITF